MQNGWKSRICFQTERYSALKSWNISNQTHQKTKGKINGSFSLTLNLLSNKFSSPLRVRITLRENGFKYLMTLDTTNALKKCCSFNFLPLCFFLTLYVYKCLTVCPEGVKEIIRFWDCAFTNMPMLIEHMIPPFFPCFVHAFPLFFFFKSHCQGMSLHWCLSLRTYYLRKLNHSKCRLYENVCASSIAIFIVPSEKK